MQQKVEAPLSEFGLPKVVTCKKVYFNNTEYGIPSYDVFNPSSPKYDSRYVKRGNPFSIGKDGTREQVIDKFRSYILKQLKVLAAIIPELTGKILCCWWQQQQQNMIKGI